VDAVEESAEQFEDPKDMVLHDLTRHQNSGGDG
jgi:hypothetical protein